MDQRRVLLIIVSVATLFPATASAVDVDDVRWGFDGRIVPGQFNLLSVLISNPTPNAFDDTLRLTRLSGNGQKIGARLEMPVFVSPFASKWVQLQPFTFTEYDRWEISWKEAEGDPVSLPQPRSSLPVSVLLDDTADLTRRATLLKLFPEQMFPTSVTATDGLRSVVLDHVPRLEAARRTAFLDWLSGGGQVHLLHGENGDFIRFPESLDALNSDRPAGRVGRGMVYRHPRTRDAVDARFLKEIAALDRHGAPEPEDSDPLTAAFDSQNVFPATYYTATNYELFNNLREMAQGGRNWTLVYVMSIAYLLLIFPGCYLLGRSRHDYRFSYLALIAGSFVFSVAFAVIGRRSVAETSEVHSIAVARPLAFGSANSDSANAIVRPSEKAGRPESESKTAAHPAGSWDVLQWSNASVTAGGWFELTHNGSGRLYSTCEELEDVNGTIFNGPQARMRVDIPPNSSRTFFHRSKLDERSFGLSLVNFDAVGSQVQSLSLAIDGEFPSDPEEVVALYRNRFYHLTVGDGLLQLSQTGTPSGQYLMSDRFNPVQVTTSPFGKPRLTVQRGYEKLFRPLLIRSLCMDYAAGDWQLRLPDDRLFVFVYAPMPREFFLQGLQFERQSGYVLYVDDFAVSNGL